MSEKNFFENTYDKVSDFINPDKVKEGTFKQTFDKALENGVITKEELTNLMTRFELEKSNLGDQTKGQLDNLKKDAVKGMFENGFDIKNTDDITNLNKFIDGTDFKKSKSLEMKLNELEAFYERVKKPGFDGVLDKTSDFLKLKDITLTLNDKNEIVEMGILDFNNPINDNEAKVSGKYDLYKAISDDETKKVADEKLKKDAEEAALGIQNSSEVKPEEIVKPLEKPKLVEKLGDATGNGNKQDEKYTKSFLEKNFDKLNSLVLNNEVLKNALVSVLQNPNEANVQALQKKLGVKSDGAFGQKTLDALSSQA